MCVREGERKGRHTVGVGERLCAHVQLCVLRKKASMSFCVPPQGRAGLLCSLDKQKIHEPAVLTCYPKAGTKPLMPHDGIHLETHTVINSSRLLIICSSLRPTEPCMIGIKLGGLILDDLYWPQCLADVCCAVHSPA